MLRGLASVASSIEEVSSLFCPFAGQRNIVGIYLSWNAASTPGFLENLSFWSKERIADRISRSAVVTKIVSAIGAITHKSANGNDQFIAIGHSFGARLLFAATVQSLIYETEQAHPGRYHGVYRTVHSPTDAIILLNPAFEASMYTSLDDVIRSDETFSDEQRPLAVTISSEGDMATKEAFPIGQWLGSARGEKELTTLGNYGPYITHDLVPMDQEKCLSNNSTAIANVFFANGLCLLRRSDAIQPNNPFIVAQTTSGIIKDHSDIWNPRFSEWLFELVAALGQSTNQSVPKATKP